MLPAQTAKAITTVLILALSFLGDHSRADWPTHRGNDWRTGFREQRLSAVRWQPAWINSDLNAPAPAWPAPARGSLWQNLTSLEPRVDDDRGHVPLIAADSMGRSHILIGSSATDRLISLDPLTGNLQWQFVADAPIRYAPCVKDGIAWFGSDDGLVRAIDLLDGRILWRTRIGPQQPMIVGNGRLISSHPIRTSLVTSNGLVFVNAGLFPSQGVYTAALNAVSGEVVWRRRTTKSPQGYLLTDNRQRLCIPCGRADPFCVAMDSGRFVCDLPSPGGSFCMVTESAFFSGPGNSAAVQSFPHLPEAKMLPIEGRTIAAGNGLLWIANGSQLACHDLQKITSRETGSRIWSVDCPLQDAMIVSGNEDNLSVFVAAGHQVRVVDGRTGQTTDELHLPDTADQIRYLSVSASTSTETADLLVATTASGQVYGWRGTSNSQPASHWPAIEQSTPQPWVVSSEIEERVQAAISDLRTDVGLALVLNDLDGRYARQLVKTSRLNVISVVPTTADRERLRSQFLSSQIYGQRLTVLAHAGGQPLPFSDRLFNLVLEAEETDYESHQLFQMVDSETGLVCQFGQLPQTAQPLDGAGVWRHQYGTPSNSADSGDAAFGGATEFRLQWFGGVGPSRMPDRHLRGQAPLAAGSAMVLHGDECLIGVDPANGTERWQVNLPPDTMRYVMPYDAGYSCLTRDGSQLFTAAAKELWKLNAFTGQQLAAYKVPDDARGLYWGYVAESDGMLVASAMKPSAARLKGEPLESIAADPNRIVKDRAARRGQFDRATLREMYTKQDYDSARPLVCSRLLFGLNDAGQQQWTYQGTGVIPNSSISLNDRGTRLVFIEGLSESCVGHSTDRVSVPHIVEDARIVCLNAATGQPIWTQPLSWPGAKNILYSLVVDDFVVLTSSESREKQGAYYHVSVRHLSTGQQAWEKQHAHITDGLGHGEQVHHPLALRQPSGRVCLVAEPYLYDLQNGETIAPDGESPDWVLKRPGHSCGTLSGAGQCIFFRATNPTVLNLSSASEERFSRLSPSRPGCWINMLPASGRLLIPEGSASCVCEFPLQTSMAFVPVTSAATDVVLLEDIPPLADEEVQQVYAWNFNREAIEGKQIRPITGKIALTASAPLQSTDEGVVMDGQQWLATDLKNPDLPAMPATLSLEARVSVAEDSPEWSALVGAVQDNGAFERGSLLGIHKQHFFFAVASDHRPSLTYLKSPEHLNADQFYHVVGTYDGNSMKLYIDGQLVAESSAQSGAVLFDQKSWLAAGIYKDDDDHHPLRGVLTSAAVFRGALTATEILQRSNSSQP